MGPSSSRGSSTKLKSGSNHLNLIQIEGSPMQNAKLGKQIPKLVPLARSSIVRQEESKSKPGANHLNLIQVKGSVAHPLQPRLIKEEWTGRTIVVDPINQDPVARYQLNELLLRQRQAGFKKKN